MILKGLIYGKKVGLYLHYNLHVYIVYKIFSYISYLPFSGNIQLEDEDKWKMSFLMPSKYGSKLPLPKNYVVTIKEVQGRIVVVVAFLG